MRRRLIRLLTVGALWAGVALFVRPALQVVRASGFCQCSGYTYAYDYYPVYYQYEGESSWGGTDSAASSAEYCLNECAYRGIYTEGYALCNQYNLNGGKGFIETQFWWDYSGDGAPSGGWYQSGQYGC